MSNPSGFVHGVSDFHTDDLQDASTGIEPLPLTDVTNAANAGPESTDKNGYAPRTARPPKQRGPPEDGIASTTKVMVANLPYDLSEEKVRYEYPVY